MAESSNSGGWRPTASLDVLKKRAYLLAQVRAFFHARDVMEVETPVMSLAGNTDPNIESFEIQSGNKNYYLHTSPEFPMKRLLSAGSGSIYQICKVFREGEAGRYHNPEFTMLEWYRPGFNHHALMDEVEGLLKVIFVDTEIQDSARITYQQAFKEHAGFDPLSISNSELVNKAAGLGFADVQGLTEEDSDAWLELLFDQVVVPKLPAATIVFVHDYPASQAALAKIREEDNVAERFEVYIDGIELANGFNELADAAEQRQRFERENALRLKQGKQSMNIDNDLLNALESGLPECAGVALGLDRLLLLLCETDSLSEVLSFTTEPVFSDQ